MMISLLKRSLPAVLLGLLLPLGGVQSAQTSGSGDPAGESQGPVEKQVDQATRERVEAARRAVLEDAVTAVDKTRQALEALANDKPDQALEYLGDATGKLELVLARDPGLALAPIAVEVRTHDLYGKAEDIEAVIERAEELLDDGRVQQARPLVAGLASEIVISTTQIPLGSYPAAIKSVTPMIDRGELDRARQSLLDALDNLVVSDLVIPLPILRAEAMLDQAQAMVTADPGESQPRQEIDRERLDALMAAVRKQLRLAESLGYGSESAYEPMYRSLDRLEQETGENGTSDNWFEALREKVSQMI